MEKVKQILTRFLIAFALISMGFAFGKNSVRNQSEAGTDSAFQGNDYVAVYYMHSTFRCITCNTIEKMTGELLNLSYAEELSDGFLKWQDVDFQENESMASQFGVVASCVVVAHLSGGKVQDFKRLDEVWTLMKEPAAFDDCISRTIDFYLKKIRGGE